MIEITAVENNTWTFEEWPISSGHIPNSKTGGCGVVWMGAPYTYCVKASRPGSSHFGVGYTPKQAQADAERRCGK